jgi:hypothetical protein
MYSWDSEDDCSSEEWMDIVRLKLYIRVYIFGVV